MVNIVSIVDVAQVFIPEVATKYEAPPEMRKGFVVLFNISIFNTLTLLFFYCGIHLYLTLPFFSLIITTWL